MVEVGLPWLLVALMAVMSAVALARAPPNAQWPMQWGFRGEVGWRAPGLAAVAVAPALAALTLFVMTVLAGPARDALGLLPLVIALIYVVTHAIYLVFALQDVRAQAMESGAQRRK